MRLCIVGASGPTGRLLVSEAQARAHDVVAFARAAAPYPDGVRAVVGDVRTPGVLDEAIVGQDAVIVLHGVSLAEANRPTDLVSVGTRNVIDSMQRAGVRRLIVQSSHGVGDSAKDAGLLARLFFWMRLRGAYADKVVQESLVRESRLDWTIVRPARLTDGPGGGQWVERLGHGPIPSSIARIDVARYLLRLAEESRHVVETVALGARG
jgi:nucleoside-diphosphate-sugar epimerase